MIADDQPSPGTMAAVLFPPAAGEERSDWEILSVKLSGNARIASATLGTGGGEPRADR